MNVSLMDLVAAARRGDVSLVAESAGYLVLALADRVATEPSRVKAESVVLDDAGNVALKSFEKAPAELVERDVRTLLARLLGEARTTSFNLNRVARHAEHGDLRRLVVEFEAALVPVNRRAARRSLARLHREVERARQRESLEPSSWELESPAVASDVLPSLPEPIRKHGAAVMPRIDDVSPSHPTCASKVPTPGEPEHPLAAGPQVLHLELELEDDPESFRALSEPFSAAARPTRGTVAPGEKTPPIESGYSEEDSTNVFAPVAPVAASNAIAPSNRAMGRLASTDSNVEATYLDAPVASVEPAAGNTELPFEETEAETNVLGAPVEEVETNVLGAPVDEVETNVLGAPVDEVETNVLGVRVDDVGGSAAGPAAQSTPVSQRVTVPPWGWESPSAPLVQVGEVQVGALAADESLLPPAADDSGDDLLSTPLGKSALRVASSASFFEALAEAAEGAATIDDGGGGHSVAQAASLEEPRPRRAAALPRTAFDFFAATPLPRPVLDRPQTPERQPTPCDLDERVAREWVSEECETPDAPETIAAPPPFVPEEYPAEAAHRPPEGTSLTRAPSDVNNLLANLAPVDGSDVAPILDSLRTLAGLDARTARNVSGLSDPRPPRQAVRSQRPHQVVVSAVGFRRDGVRFP